MLQVLELFRSWSRCMQASVEIYRFPNVKYFIDTTWCGSRSSTWLLL